VEPSSPPSPSTLPEEAPASRSRFSPAFRRNFTLGVLNGILFNISDSLISTNLVLPGLIRLLGGGNVLVATLPAIDVGGWLLPQLLVGAKVQGRPRQLPTYQVSAVLRSVFFAGLVVAIALVGRIAPGVALAAFFLLYSLYGLGAGIAGVPFQEVVAKTIPPDRRGAYFGLRQIGGGVFTLAVVSWVVRMVLQEGSRLSFPHNYALLFGLAFLFAMAGLVSFGLVVEPAAPEAGVAGSLVAQLRRLPAMWREQPDLRKFLVYKVFSRLAQVAEPFYVVYAVEVLGAPAALIGDYLAAITVVQLASYLVWSRLSDRQGNRLLLRWGSGLAAVAPPLALFLPLLGQGLGLGVRANAYLFGLVFVLSGLGNASLSIGIGNYVLEALPGRDRPAGLGLINTITGVVSVLMILGGSLADVVGYRPLFWVAVATGIGSFLLSLPLLEPRKSISATHWP